MLSVIFAFFFGQQTQHVMAREKQHSLVEGKQARQCNKILQGSQRRTKHYTTCTANKRKDRKKHNFLQPGSTTQVFPTKIFTLIFHEKQTSKKNATKGPQRCRVEKNIAYTQHLRQAKKQKNQRKNREKKNVYITLQVNI